MGNILVIKQGNIHNAIREQPFVADILVMDGKIVEIAEHIAAADNVQAAENAQAGNTCRSQDGDSAAVQILDATGLDVYPGFVDAHCHIGLDGYGIGFEGEDFNEMGDAVTPDLSAIDGINPQDITFEQARSGGVTCVCTGPGSSNVIGGTFCAIKTYGRRVDDMIVKEKAAMKIAFGENPKNCYKTKGVYSRMSIAAKLRENLTKARIYDGKLRAAGCNEGKYPHLPFGTDSRKYQDSSGTDSRKYQDSSGTDSRKYQDLPSGTDGTDCPDSIDWSKMPAYDPKLEALVPVVRREMPLKAHAHRADDIFTAIRIAKEFGLKLAIDHTTEGHQIAEELAKEGFPVSVGPTFGHATKYELRNKSFETPAVLAAAGCRVSIITDSPVIEQRFLAHCVGMAIYNGLDEFIGLQSVTINAAKHIGIEDRVGSIEVGKDGDFVLVKGNPFVLDATILYTIIDGKIVYRA